MRNSLLFRLMGAFLLVVAVSALVFAGLTYRSTRSAFTLYTTRSGQIWAERLAPVLVSYYTENDGWQGVEALLETESALVESESNSHQPSGQGRGRGQGQGQGATAGAGQAGMWAILDMRLILADAQGVVIGDSADQLTGQSLTPSQQELGAPLSAEGMKVGTLLVTPGDTVGADSPAAKFLSSINQSILIAVLIAGLIALALGALLFFQITAPLRRLNQAVGAVEQGDLGQRVSVTSQDELGRLSQSFNRMAEGLQQSETRRQRLVADVAHELRTPIAILQANLEALLDGVMPLENEQVAILYDETLLLNRLVDDLRLLSLAEAGQLILSRQEIDLAALIERLADRFKVQLEEKGIRLELDLADHLPKLSIDADRITQVMSNLVGNALRYTPPGGFIQVRTELQGNAVQVAVTDSGNGIPQADLPYIFERFYRADPSRARQSGGSGLGLAIVRQLVEAHGGRVEAASPVFQDGQGRGFGTKMTFTLDIQPELASVPFPPHVS
jgi:signal transduction histidine kinase